MQTPEQVALHRAAVELAGAELHALADDVLRALARLAALEAVAAAAREKHDANLISPPCQCPLGAALARLDALEGGRADG